MAESEYRRILRERLGAPVTQPQVETKRGPEAGPRVQKNLSLLRADAQRLALLARRDKRSQARLIAEALDCYERAFGRLPDTAGG
jgi:hypothetical protein